jgi:transglutaminase-like putative cysteine protease
MTDEGQPIATASRRSTGSPEPAHHVRARPALPLAGGWVSQALVLVMLLVTGMAIHDLRPVGGAAAPGATAWLPLLMVAAGLTGGVLAATRLRAGWVDLLAALLGTVVGLVVVASAVSDAPSVVDRVRDLEASISAALGDLLVERVQGTEVSPFLLTLAAIAWTTGAYAAISVGRHGRAAGAVVPIGLMLLVPVILAEVRGQESGQLLWLAIGVTAALLLVLRLNLERQRVRWLRRHVTGGPSLGRSFLGGGAVLVGTVMVGAIGLTALTGSAPLAAGWERLGWVLGDLGVDVGQLRQQPDGLSGGFPDHMKLQSTWTPRAVTYFTAVTEGPHYWRAATYDRFDGTTWYRTDTASVDLVAFDDLEGATSDIASGDLDGFADVEATITFQDLGGDDLVAPQNPVQVDRETRMLTLTEAGPFQLLQSREGMGSGSQYVVQALEPALSRDSEDPLTVALLRSTGDQPDPDWVGRYLQVPDQVGKRTTARARDIKGDHTDRYWLARRVQAYLTSSLFAYDTAPQACRQGESVTDCLLRTHAGFCERYATTMVMLLRLMDVPARYVVGYLPGAQEGTEWVVTGAAAHAWVEVWFDGFGWVRFDPTPGTSPAASDLLANGQSQTQLAAGDDAQSPDGGPDATFPPDETFPPEESPGPEESDEPSPEPSVAPADVAPVAGGGGIDIPPVELVVGAAGLAVALVALVALLWFRRLPGGGPEQAWRGIVDVASRFGRGPTATQTPYEYSVTLARVVPRVAQDIRTVADAKVAATYGRAHGEGSTSSALRGAYARARIGLLTLLFRRR